MYVRNNTSADGILNVLPNLLANDSNRRKIKPRNKSNYRNRL